LDAEYRICGIIACPHPFKGNGETVDTETLPRLIDQLIDNGAHAIAPLGSTGESAYLTDAEWEEVAEVAIASEPTGSHYD